MFDAEYCVVGNGLIGAAAALECTTRTSAVCVIGAAFGASGRYFSSHQDDTRLTRSHHRDSYWQRLAERNHVLIDELMRATGEPIRRELPVLFSPSAVGPSHERCRSAVASDGHPTLARFAFQDHDGGVIDPRTYIHAMNRRARDGGATVFDESVTCIRREGDRFRIITDCRVINAAQVVEATGIHRWLLADSGCRAVGKVVVHVQHDELASDSFGFIDADHGGAAFDDVYGICGYRRLGDACVSKFGFSERVPIVLDDEQAVRDWFTGGFAEYPHTDEAFMWIEDFLRRPVRRFRIKPCAFSTTPSRRLQIAVDRGWIGVAGCNGMAAKCCQAIAERLLESLDASEEVM